MAKTGEDNNKDAVQGSSSARRKRDKSYYYIDISVRSQQIIGWGIEKLPNVEVTLSRGFHRTFLSRGQYNKLVKELEADL